MFDKPGWSARSDSPRGSSTPASVVTNDAVARYEGGTMNVSATASTPVPAATAAACRQRESAPARTIAKVGGPEAMGDPRRARAARPPSRGREPNPGARVARVEDAL